MPDDSDIPDVCDWPTTDCAFKVRHDQELATSQHNLELAVGAGQEWKKNSEEKSIIILQWEKKLDEAAFHLKERGTERDDWKKKHDHQQAEAIYYKEESARFQKESLDHFNELQRMGSVMSLQIREFRKTLVDLMKGAPARPLAQVFEMIEKALAIVPTQAEKEVEFLLELENDSRVEHRTCEDPECSICYGLGMLGKLRKGE